MLHTRISEQLADDIRRLAENLRVPTSNLVRNVLEEVFTMVESVSEDVGGILDDVLDEAEAARERVRRRVVRRRRPHTDTPRGAAFSEEFDAGVERELQRDEDAEGGDPADVFDTGPDVENQPHPTFPDVLGWQSLVINHDRRCDCCGLDLPRGSEAFMGLGVHGMTDRTLCRSCTGARD